MPYPLFTLCGGIMWTLISLPLQMAERLRRAQPVSITNHIKARQSLIECAVTWLATESGWARRKRSAICSGKLCGGFVIFEQCCPCNLDHYNNYWLIDWLMGLLKMKAMSSSSRCFKHSAAINWNDLPFDIRACDSVNVFKRKLKTHLFNISYAT